MKQEEREKMEVFDLVKKAKKDARESMIISIVALAVAVIKLVLSIVLK